MRNNGSQLPGTLSARAGHGRQDVAGVLQAYRNRTAQLASLTDEDNQTLQGKFVTQLQGGTEENSLQQKTENRTGLRSAESRCGESFGIQFRWGKGSL